MKGDYTHKSIIAEQDKAERVVDVSIWFAVLVGVVIGIVGTLIVIGIL